MFNKELYTNKKDYDNIRNNIEVLKNKLNISSHMAQLGHFSRSQ